VVRKANTIWIFNPEFLEPDYQNNPPPLRLASIRGVRVVQSLVKNIGAHGANIAYCFIQRIAEQDNLTCIGRSVQWIEGVLDASNLDPFIPGPDQPATWFGLSLIGLPAA